MEHQEKICSQCGCLSGKLIEDNDGELLCNYCIRVKRMHLKTTPLEKKLTILFPKSLLRKKGERIPQKSKKDRK